MGRGDRERLDVQMAGDIVFGNALSKGNTPVPTPLSQPRQARRAPNEESAAALDEPVVSRLPFPVQAVHGEKGVGATISTSRGRRAA